MLAIIPLPCLTDNYIWCLCHLQKKEIWLVDPGEAPPVEAFLQKKGLRLRGVICTHHHQDHIGGLAALWQNHGAAASLGLIAHEACKPYFNFDKANATFVTGGQTLKLWDELQLLCLATPGHTLSSISYYCPELCALYSGDTLFSSGCGRLFEGDHAMMLDSLNKLAALPAETKLYCGHEYTLKNAMFSLQLFPEDNILAQRLKDVRQRRQQLLPTLPTTLADELRWNLFLRCDDKSLQQRLGLTTSLDVFRYLRAKRDIF